MACCQDEGTVCAPCPSCVFPLASKVVGSVLMPPRGASTSGSLSELNHRFLPRLFPFTSRTVAFARGVPCVSIPSSVGTVSNETLRIWNDGSASFAVSPAEADPRRTDRIPSPSFSFQIDVLPKSDTSPGSRRYASASTSSIASTALRFGSVRN
eukprot:scaffold1619_cov292-Pavlova_lutheri.AAC.3